MPKISKIFKLGKGQSELDFVDIDTERDFPIYLNPFVFSAREDNFSYEASRTVVSFFSHNLELIRVGKILEAKNNFRHLNEVNDTCLGMSIGNPRGNGVGNENSVRIFDSIRTSKAVTSGIVQDLEDTSIFIEGIGKDKVSDMTTNIIRLDLIKYTQEQCNLHNIPLQQNKWSGFFWNVDENKWDQKLTEMLMINNKLILLVPKAVVSFVREFDHQNYHNNFALDFLQDDHLNRNTNLVQVRKKNKKRFVTKKSLIEKELPFGKINLIEFTKKYPEIFDKFKKETKSKIKSLKNEELDENINEEEVINHLINELKNIPSGNKDANNYHNLMIGILELIFYPDLIRPKKENPINDGRKRIDISFENSGPKSGFFHKLQHAKNIPCPYIHFECKNYSTDINNPELDQMVGRLSPNRGKFGVILCRNINDENLFTKKCIDSYNANHGLIITLTDDDIINILENNIKNKNKLDDILSEKIDKIIFG